MRRHRTPWTTCLILLTLLFGSLSYAQPNRTMTTYNQDTYEQAWKAIDSLEREGLWRSALDQVNQLYTRAKGDNNPGQVIKTLIYRSKFEAALEEDGLVNAIARLEAEAAGETFPVQPILQSLLGEMYQKYLDQNIWRIGDRTELVEYRSDDLQTWTAEQITRRILELFAASIRDERLEQAPIGNFNAITTEPKNADGLRPTLYDFLAFRAVDQFRNERTYLTQPAYQFQIREAAAFADAETFIAHRFETRDTASYQYRALLLFQDLLRRHRGDANPAAFLDADLQRLSFAYAKSVNDRKEEHYRDALQRLRTRYANRPAAAEIDYELAYWHYLQGQRYDPRHATEQQWAYKTAKEICEAAIKAWPDSYGAGQCRLLLSQILVQSLEVQTESVNPTGRPLLARVDYRNVSRAFFRLVAVTMDDRDSLNRLNTTDKLGYLLGKRSLRQWRVDLPAVGDYQNHSTEMAIDALPAGQYALMIGVDDSFSGEGGPAGLLFFYVSDIAALQRSAGDGSEFLLLDRLTGAPLAGVKAEFFVNDYNRQRRRHERRLAGSATSDADGLLRTGLPPDTYYLVRFSRGEDVLFTGEGFSNYSRFYREPEVQQTTHFFLDRAIYRPGQTVYFKGIALERDAAGRPRLLTGEPVTVTFYDVNHQAVDDVELTTNDYGTFQGSFRAPEGGLRGAMSLESSIGEASIAFQVEEYKRPRFEVTFDPFAEDYDLGDEVAVRGKAMAFAGSAVDGALVQYRVVREVRFPWWPVWQGGYFFPPVRGQETEIANGVTNTGADGTFGLTFTALADPSIPRDQNPSFVFTIYADVVDITGETRSAEKRVQLAYLGLQAAVDVPKQADRTAPLKLTIRTTNLDGQPVPAGGRLAIHRLEAPEEAFISRYWDAPDQYLLTASDYRERFPHYAYRGEDEPANWPRAGGVYDQPFQTTGGADLTIDAGNWPVGHYEVHLTTSDSEGNPIEVKTFIQLYDRRQGLVPAGMTGWEKVDGETFEPGDVATVLLATGAPTLHVRYELERDQRITDSRWLTVDRWSEAPYTITEADRGNVLCHLTYVRFNRVFSSVHTLAVPWTNKQLRIEYTTFRDKLRPGQPEEWRLKLSGPAGERVAAEMVATLYDASLDQFVIHNWNFDPFPVHTYAVRRWSAWSFDASRYELDRYRRPSPPDAPERQYRFLNWFGLERYADFGGYGGVQFRALADSAMPEAAVAMQKSAVPAALEPDADVVVTFDPGDQAPPQGEQPAPAEGQVRTNLKETVFFLPELRTDEAGNVIISFTMNEALTRWKFLALAHTPDLAYGLSSREVVTQKELMVLPNAPRFVREGDEVEFAAKVSNLSGQALRGTATLQLFDAMTMEPVDAALSNNQPNVAFDAAAGQSARVAWKLRVPAGKVGVLLHRVVASAGDFSDGEEDALPVLTNRMLVTESMPMTLRGRERKTFTFDRLPLMQRSPTLKPQALTLEFTSNPAWYAVKALPYMMEYPHECAEQIFSRLYANSLAGAVVEAHPALRDVFDKWRAAGGLQSELMRNEELKGVLLAETPWVLEAQSEEQQRRNIALLFDLDRMRRERATAVRKLAEMQQPDGGFPWFAGGPGNWFVTQYIVEGMGRLLRLNIPMGEDETAGSFTREAIGYIDRQITEAYQELERQAAEGRLKLEEDHLFSLAIHYLYARSFFSEIPRDEPVEEAWHYFMGQAEKYWLDKGVYQQGLLTLALHREGREEAAQRIVRSLRERALRSEELGMYWKYNRGWFWWEMPVETQALMIEVFAEVGRDAEAVESMRIWLLKNKQTNHWNTTKATAAAVYALFNEGDDLAGDLLAPATQVSIDFPNLRKRLYQEELQAAAAQAEAGTGYFQVRWEEAAVRPDMAEIRVKNPNRNIAWGSLYWQYFEDLDKITTFEETPLQLKKQLFRTVPSDRGPELQTVAAGDRLTPGDLLTVRIELRVDRDMEFVHMKDLRASGLEPVNVLSQYKWQGGLGYYESTGDAATNFFFDILPRGTYVFEYPLRVSLQGDFSNGVTTIQCMYAPEFTSHSEGVRIRVAAEEN